MATCSRCHRSWKEPEDEQGAFDCPCCGPYPKDEDEKEEKEEDREDDLSVSDPAIYYKDFFFRLETAALLLLWGSLLSVSISS